MHAGAGDSEVAARRSKPTPAGTIRRVGGGLATFLLEGLTTIEVIAIAIGTVAVVGFLWATGRVEPEVLISESGLRAAWILLVLALVRPLTWIPYLLPFLALRWVVDRLMPRTRMVLRNALVNLLTIGILAGVTWLMVGAVTGAGTDILSVVAFATGSGSFAELGTFRGEWNPARVTLVVAFVIFVRVGIPPLGRDLDLSDKPVLGFAPGGRGAFDRYLLVISILASAGLGLAAYLLGGA